MMVKEITAALQLSQVLDDTYPLWGEGLSRRAYGAWNRAQGLTSWGRRRLSLVGLVRDGRVVTSAKRYVFDATAEGKPLKVLGIGAVFTAEAFRGQGLAEQLLEAMCEDGRATGCDVALLFSTIGMDYYARLGFTAVARTVVTLDVPRNRLGAPATLVRAAESADLPVLAEISVQYGQDASLALSRSADLIEFGVTRRRLLAGLGPSGLRSVEFFVSEEGRKAVAYVVISRGSGGVSDVFLEECGDRDPSGARVGAMLEVLAAREPAHEDRTLKAWWPETFRPPQIKIIGQAAAPEAMMARSLTGRSPQYRQAVFWQTDVF